MDILKNIFIDSNGNLNIDLIIKILIPLGVFSIPTCIINVFNNFSSRYRRYRIFTKNTKKQILNTLLFPWEDDKRKFGVDYKRFYIKKINIKNLETLSNKVIIKKGLNMLFLGKPGSGKTTYLNHLYLSQFSFINNIIHFYYGYRFYYAKAEELLEITDKTSGALSDIFKPNLKSRVFIFLDAIDEVKLDNIDNLVKKLIYLQKNNITIIATCRKEDHEIFLRVNNQYSTIIDQVFEIEDWNTSQVSEYVDKYNKYAKSNDFITRVEKYLTDESYTDFFRTPLELSLIIFIIDNSFTINLVQNKYDLYEQFLKKWIIRDCTKNKISYENTNYINETLYSFSKCAFLLTEKEKVKSSDILIQVTSTHQYCLDGLLRYERINENKYIVGFYHLNFNDFFLAYFFFNSMLKLSENTIKALSVIYNHTSTRFIKNKFLLSKNEELDTIKNSLLIAMCKVCRIPSNRLQINNIIHNQNFPADAKNYFNKLNDNQKTIVRNEIYFFLARLPWNQNNQNRDFLRVLQLAYEYEHDIRAKRTIAISATILGDENIELEYARKILSDSDSNLIDRSFTLVYYQDVSHSNPFTYIDDNVSQWTNSRKIRINRLKSTDEKSQRMRSFDLITILNFIKSRNGYIPTQDEYDAIINCQIDCSFYSNEKKELLSEVKNKLLNLIDTP